MAEFDNYLPCDQYHAAPASEKYPGFKSWFESDTNAWYFAAVTNLGRVVLRSEAYTTESARDNGIESVNRNRDIEARYSVIQESDGKWYIILKAGNHQEIARSCPHDSEAAARADIAFCSSTAIETASGRIEDYLPCESYAGQTPAEKHPEFVTFQDETDQQYYFAQVSKSGEVQLRSEGYTTAASRDNGIESVIRNREIEERYSVRQNDDDQQWYVSLKAGNHQEIARSCPYDSEAGALLLIKNILHPQHAAIVEDYLPCASYVGHSFAEKHPGFTTFTSPETGQHYFAMLDGHGSVILRSEAYTTPGARDNGIESVLRNRDIEERYNIVEEDGLWYVCLKAGNHQEIARSCGIVSKAAAEGHLLHCYSKAALQKIASGTGEITEDYLPCTAYENKQPSHVEGFTIFQDESTKLHYFAMLGDDGKIALKSEGYKDPKRRDNGIESVIRNRGIKDHWRELEGEHGHYMSLRAVNHQEIARSCHYKDKGMMLAWFAPLLAAHANWDKDAEPEDKTALAAIAAAAVPVVSGALAANDKSAAAPKKVVVTDKPAAAVPPPVSSYTNAPVEATASGNDWWKWLLAALLLLGLLWLLMRGCEGCGSKKTAMDTPAPVTATPAPAATPPAATAPAPVVASCNCEAQTDPVFRSNSGTPKSLHRLGTNPEFGNSHGLSPAEFFAKLQTRHKENSTDRTFLDRMYKAMGYTNGFKDAKAEQFTAVELPAGTVGNIGYSATHKTLYARLDTEGKDLMAFRIKSANGCDLHFMKTCGNHFFFCGK